MPLDCTFQDGLFYVKFTSMLKKKNGIGFEEHLKIFPASLTLPNIAIKFIPDSSKTFPMTIRHCLYCSKFIEIKITFDIFKDM